MRLLSHSTNEEVMASARMDRSNPSIVEWFAEHEGYRCGYCKQEDSNYSHGMSLCCHCTLILYTVQVC